MKGKYETEGKHCNELEGLSRWMTSSNVPKVTDISLHDSEEFFKTIFNSIEDSVAVIDPKNFRIVGVNSAFLNSLNSEEEAIIGKHCCEVMHHRTTPCCTSDHSCPVTETLKTGNRSVAEHIHYDKEGKKIYVEVSTSLIKEGNGEYKKVILIARNLSQRSQVKNSRYFKQDSFMNILNSTEHGVYIVDEAYVINYISPQLQGEFGPFEGKKCYEYFHDQKNVCPWCKSLDVFGGKTFYWERYSLNDRKMYDQIGTLLKNPDGSISKLRVFHDVTKQKRIEENLNETKDYLNNLIENALDSIMLSDKKGYITRVNKFFLELLGYRKEEVIGKHVMEFTPLNNEGMYQTTTGKLIQIDKNYLDDAKRTISTLLTEGKISSWSNYYLRKDQILIPVEQNIVCLHNKSGERIGAFSIVRDITERKRAEETLQKSEKKLHELIDFANVGIIISENNKITQVNKKAEEIYGYSKKELIGQSPRILSTEKYHGQHKEMLDDIIKLGKAKKTVFEEEAIKKDGSCFPIEISFALTQSGENTIIAVMRDITERKQAETKLIDYQNKLRSLASQLTLTEEEERLRVATELHDSIGQTLAISKMKLADLREAPLSDDLVKSIGEIYGLIMQANKDTRSLIKGLKPPALYQLGFEKAIEGLTKDITEQNNILIAFEDDGQPKPLKDDTRTLLYNAVRELLVNIIKHAQAQRVRVSIKRNGNVMQSVVEDDGIGFDTSEVNSFAYRNGCFGLFSIRERLHYIGGQFKLASEPGRGTCVTLEAPLKEFDTL